MINYSVGPRINPQNLEEDPLFFATSQIDRNLDINEFAKHIASHGCVYSRADIAAVAYPFKVRGGSPGCRVYTTRLDDKAKRDLSIDL